MSSLAQQRCFNHATREAAARCPSCRRFFCRECVVEHEHTLLCAQCLAATLQEEEKRGRRFLGTIRAAVRLSAGILLLWALFWLGGRLLILVPSAFHDPPAVAAGVGL